MHVDVYLRERVCEGARLVDSVAVGRMDEGVYPKHRCVWVWVWVCVLHTRSSLWVGVGVGVCITYSQLAAGGCGCGCV